MYLFHNKSLSFPMYCFIVTCFFSLNFVTKNLGSRLWRENKGPRGPYFFPGELGFSIGVLGTQQAVHLLFFHQINVAWSRIQDKHEHLPHRLFATLSFDL